jgi:hypothetical protein
VNRSKLGILAALIVVLAGCSTTNMTQEGETVATIPLMPAGLMPSWDQRSRSRMDDAPRVRTSTPWVEFLLTLPFTPLLMPSWEEERPPLSTARKKENIGGWWRNRVGTIKRRKKKKKEIKIEAISVGGQGENGGPPEDNASEDDAPDPEEVDPPLEDE